MKHVLKVIIVNTLTLSSAQALVKKAPFVVYGTDDRQEVYEATATHQAWAKSTAALVSKLEMTPDPAGSGLIHLTQKPLTDFLKKYMGFPACSDLRFAQQPKPGMCSGFLIAPDLIVTAGHCIELDNFCDEYKWVFDFQLDAKTKTAGLDIKPENIFNCKKVVSYKLDGRAEIDYGVVLLDRKVTDREPLLLRSEGKVSDTQELLVIGHPSGLPTKVATGASIRRNDHPEYFVANLDTFQGNSGSPVFNAGSGVVEGLLVRGEDDYVINEDKFCVDVKSCGLDECRGEDISRMTSIPEVLNDKAFKAAAGSGDVKIIEKFLQEGLYPDFHGKDGKTALMLAAAATQAEVIKALLAMNADVNVTDAAEETALHILARNLTKPGKESLGLLVKAGAKLEAKNVAGDTALIVAGKALNLESAKLLIKSGANVRAVDSKGESVVFGFARAGDIEALIALNKLGVDLRPVAPIVGKHVRLKHFFRKLFKKKSSKKSI